LPDEHEQKIASAMALRSILGNIAEHLPRSIIDLGTRLYNRIPIEARYGAVFRAAAERLERSQFWTAEQHADWQLTELRKLIRHAYDHVPFYRRLYDRNGFTPDDIRRLEDIRHLPFTSKQDLRDHLEEMRATNFSPSRFQYHTTGGSTGKPVGLYWDADRTVPLEKAFMRRQWRWAGFEMERDRSAILRGLPVKQGELYERLGGNQIRLSTYTMTESTIDAYLDLLDIYKPVAIQAYPSAAYIFAQHVLRRGGHRFESLRTILCGSENLYPWQRTVIEEAFGCRVYSWYGQSEYVALGGGCEHSTDYHFYSEYGLTEILDSNNSEVGGGEEGEIVATGFNNLAFPLIRYRTEDIARRSPRPSCICGRQYLRVESVEGRLQEMIVSRHGNLISMTALNMHSDVFDELYQFQFFQDTPGVVVFRAIPKPTYSTADEARILAALREKLTDQFDIRIELVDVIEPTLRGTTSFLVQKLPVDMRRR
jgi:phenylacetate-CoA ligase